MPHRGHQKVPPCFIHGKRVSPHCVALIGNEGEGQRQRSVCAPKLSLAARMRLQEQVRLIGPRFNFRDHAAPQTPAGATVFYSWQTCVSTLRRSHRQGRGGATAEECVCAKTIAHCTNEASRASAFNRPEVQLSRRCRTVDTRRCHRVLNDGKRVSPQCSYRAVDCLPAELVFSP